MRDIYSKGLVEQDKKKHIYLYPITPYNYRKGVNDYILRVKEHLGEEFVVVNKATRLGILDILLKFGKTDIIYFNWIADLPDKRLGYVQTFMLVILLLLSKLRVRKLCGLFIMKYLTTKNWLAKMFIRKLMMRFADVTLFHSKEISLKTKLSELKVFDHPVDEISSLKEHRYAYDLLVWGSVSPYKGVLDFIQYNSSTERLQDLNILVAGKFLSLKLYRRACRFVKSNIEIVNQAPTDEELEELFSRSRYILFCYKSNSVLSSAALCKSLSYGKTVIGPNVGAFKELGEKGLLYTYNSFDELVELIHFLKKENVHISAEALKAYAAGTSWKDFKNFLVETLRSGGTKTLEPHQVVTT